MKISEAKETKEICRLAYGVAMDTNQNMAGNTTV